ncbi:MAG: hypothetical protein ABSC49_01735 [Candidatus Microgenomates bacterium]|jgi:hypothetical protein
MERKPNLNPPPQESEKHSPIVPCETPRENGSKPAETLRIAENCKKHIKRDGRK